MDHQQLYDAGGAVRRLVRSPLRPSYAWLLITDDPHSETGIPEGFGALHRNTGIPEGLVSETKAKLPYE
jgi:hypothetical protein